jgi:Helix-turn-helix domain
MHPDTRMADDIDRDLDFVTLKEAAQICRLKRTDQIRAAIKRRELPRIRISARHILIPREAIIRWLLARASRPKKNGSK